MTFCRNTKIKIIPTRDYCSRVGIDYCQNVAPGVVSVLDNGSSVAGGQAGNVALKVSGVVEQTAIPIHRHGGTTGIVVEVQVAGCKCRTASVGQGRGCLDVQPDQVAAVVNVAVFLHNCGLQCPFLTVVIGCDGFLSPQAIGVILVIDGDIVFTTVNVFASHRYQLTAVFPGIGPSAVGEHVADGVAGDSVAIVGGQQITPCVVIVVPLHGAENMLTRFAALPIGWNPSFIFYYFRDIFVFSWG